MTNPEPPVDDDSTQPPMISPLVFHFGDYQENAIVISILFDPITRLLLGATSYRHPECLYKKVYIGLGADGVPDSTPDFLTIPLGNTSIGAAPLRRNALRTIDDVVALQITAGP